MYLRKIISDGLTFAGMGGLEAAGDLGLAADGPEAGAASPEDLRRPRVSKAPTRLTVARNVAAADATLFFGGAAAADDDGRRICRSAARLHRPCLRIALTGAGAAGFTGRIREWLAAHRIRTLHVTGSPADDRPIYRELARRVLRDACLGAFAARDLPGVRLEDGPETGCPDSVREAVDQLVLRLSLRDRAAIARMPAGELVALNSTLGIFIRHRFRLWSGNEELLASCRQEAGDAGLRPREAAGLIVEMLWRRLRRTHRLRPAPE